MSENKRLKRKGRPGLRRRAPVSAISHRHGQTRTEKGGTRLARMAWLCGCLGLLALAFFQAEKSDHEFVFVAGMIALSFPAGVLVAAGFAVVIKASYYFFQTAVPSSFAFDLLMWPFFVAAGYAQWFVLPRRLAVRFSRSG